MAGRCVLLSCGFSPTHDPPRPGQGEKPCTCVGSGAWGRRQGLAGLRDDAPSEARGADGERAGRRPRAPTRRQAREHKLRRRRAVSSQRGGRKAGSSQRGLRDDTPSEARSAGFETTRRAKLTARTPSGRAERAAHGTDAEQAGQANGPRRGRRAGGPSGQLTARTPSRRAAAPGHQHAEHAHTTRPGPAAPNSAEDPSLVKQSDQAVHHEGGECFERGLDLALGQRCERCDGIVGPGAREFARLIEHVVGAQAVHDRGEGLVRG